MLLKGVYMIKKFRIEIYLAIYALFVCLYIYNFKDNLSDANIKLCLCSSILPALVGGTIANLLFKKEKIN